MGSALFWLLVFPVLLAAVLVYLGVLVVGLGTIRIAFGSRSPAVRALLIVAGVLVIASPALYHLGADKLARQRADLRQTDLASLERVDLAGRLPGRFIAVGNFRPELIDSIRSRYGMSIFPEAENNRLVEAYRLHRRAELCHRRFGDQKVPGTALPKCKPMADSIQSALDLREPILVFAEGRHTSMREDNVIAGEIYEIRLITPREDLLVAYFEERTVESATSIFNPYAPPRRRASDERAPTLQEFIETALQGADR